MQCWNTPSLYIAGAGWSRRWSRNVLGLVLALTPLTAPAQVVDNATLTGKTMAGYQGWFMAPGDGNPQGIGWRHYTRTELAIGPGQYTVDMWPDVTEYEQTFPAPGVTLLDGSPGRLFSSVTPSTTRLHFKWMKEHNIDGIFLQRFVGELTVDPRFRVIRDTVLSNVRAAASEHGRIFAIEYDTSGCPPELLLNGIINDWKHLVDTFDITNDPRYLHHDGKPVVEIWGLGFTDRPHTAQTAAAIIDFFRNDPVYGGNLLIGGVPSWWRTLNNDSLSDPAWANVYRSWDILNPWMVGRYRSYADILAFRNDVIAPDLIETQSLGIGYMPVIWPGFSWDNLMNLPPGTSKVSRDGGNFLWNQAYNWIDAGAEMLFVAMFDELDESTAIFKVSNNHPNTDNWVTYEGYPSDWYLDLTGAANAMLKGDIALTDTIPITPNPGRIRGNFTPGFVEEGMRIELEAPETVADPPQYQWKKNGLELTGETSRMLILDPVTMEDAGAYSVSFENGLAKAIVETPPLQLDVLPQGSLPVGKGVALMLLVALGILGIAGQTIKKARAAVGVQ